VSEEFYDAMTATLKAVELLKPASDMDIAATFGAAATILMEREGEGEGDAG
jgi:hypothetical protein